MSMNKLYVIEKHSSAGFVPSPGLRSRGTRRFSVVPLFSCWQEPYLFLRLVHLEKDENISFCCDSNVPTPTPVTHVMQYATTSPSTTHHVHRAKGLPRRFFARYSFLWLGTENPMGETGPPENVETDDKGEQP